MTKIDSLAGSDLLGDQFGYAADRRLASRSQVDEVLTRFVTQHFVIEEMEIIMRQWCLLLLFALYAPRRIPFQASPTLVTAQLTSLNSC
jgi:hypothetical protein